MKHRIRKVLIGLRNIWKWRKVIYNDRDWDFWFVYEILKTKLKFQASYTLKHGYHESSPEDARKMLECIDLIEKVQNDYYIEQAIDGMDRYSWTDEMFNEALERQATAKKLLFKTLEENIERWWD